MSPEEEFMAFLAGIAPEPAPDPFMEQVFSELPLQESDQMGYAPPLQYRGPSISPISQMESDLPSLPFVPEGGGNFFNESYPLDLSQIEDRRGEKPNPIRDFIRGFDANIGGGYIDMLPRPRSVFGEPPSPPPWIQEDPLYPDNLNFVQYFLQRGR